jgi:sugar lactone lactonase YvrE
VVNGSPINDPHGITFDSNSGPNIWLVDDSAPGKLLGYSTTGTSVFSSNYYTGTSTYDEPWGIWTDSNGNLYIADEDNNQVEVVGPLGVYIGIAVSGLTSPTNVAVNSAGTTLYITEETTPDVTFLAYKITGSSYPKTYTLITTDSFPTSGTYDPGGAPGMTLDSSGNVYVSDGKNHDIVKYGPTGGGAAVFVAASSSTSPNFMAFDGSGNMWVTENDLGVFQYIQEYSSAGSAGVSVGYSHFSDLEGIAVDGSGNLFVGDAGTNQIYEIQK